MVSDKEFGDNELSEIGPVIKGREPMGLFFKWRKSGDVLRIAKAVSMPRTTVESLLDASRDDAFEELFDLCESDTDCAVVMADHNLDRESLMRIYQLMLACGAGQWVGHHYVPVSTIAYAKLLHMAADGFSSDGSRDEHQRVAVQLIQVVERGRFS